MLMRVQILTLRLTRPLVTATDRTDVVKELVVELLDGCNCGIGSARLGTACDTVESLAADGITTLEMRTIRDATAASVCADPALIGPFSVALEIATLDYQARLDDLSIWESLGTGAPIRAPSAITLGLAPRDVLLERVAFYRNWPILKLKIKRGFDAALIGDIRELYKGRLWIDANGSLDYDAAQGLIYSLEPYDVEILEQPINAKQLGRIHELVRPPQLRIAIDQTLDINPDELGGKGVDVVNIKLERLGGLVKAARLARRLRRHGTEIMIGCRTGSALAVSAAAQLLGLADFVDLDGQEDIEDDPFDGVRLDRGSVLFPARTGHGCIWRTEVNHAS